jgi:hypothetical protein
MTAPAKDRDSVVAEGGARVGAAAPAGGRRARHRADAATTIAWAASRAGFNLPVRVRAWDGSEAGPAGPPTAVLRSPRALRRALWAPGELGLARAYVSGDLDVEGDLTEGLRRAFRAARPAQSGRASGGGASGGRASGARVSRGRVSRGRVSRGRVSRGRVSRGRVSRGREPGAWSGWGPGRWADVVSAAAVAARRLGVFGPQHESQVLLLFVL